jgi:putative nucleotidyltransferase with HDIG domain
MPIQKGMSSVALSPQAACVQFDRARVDARLSGCACLPSLSTIDSALRELLGADQSHTSQIADLIRRDPGLSARLLRLVHAVHYGKGKAPTNIDEAVLYVGVRQIRQLAMVTQIIEDFQKVVEQQQFPWRQFWRHSIATALLTREITNLVQSKDDEIDYVAGLMHDVGKIVMALAFPEHFSEIYQHRAEEAGDLMRTERELLGVDHADLGAMYLRKQRLPEVYVEIVQYHHAPLLARQHRGVTASVHVADLLVRHAKIGYSGNHAPSPLDACLASPAWKILFGHQSQEESGFSRDSLLRSLEHIPDVLDSIV